MAKRTGRLASAFRVALVALLAACALDFAAFKLGWWIQRPAVFAGLVTALLAALLVEGLRSIVLAFRGETPPASSTAKIAGLAGLTLVLGGGLANWLFGLQGFVVLTEGDGVPLFRGSHLEGFNRGPLSNPGEMALTLKLDEVKLVPGTEGGFLPESHLVLKPGEAAPIPLEIGRRHHAAAGTLRFYQGAFGFSPRIVILEKERTVFDESVPFTTRREGKSGVAFEGELRIEKESIAIRAAVDLDSLDDRMRGHPRLAIEVRKGEQLLGSGELLLGHFAELKDGYRVGFAGVKKWSEIDISRRDYPQPMLAGAGLVALSLVMWPVAAWRRR